MNPDHLLLLIVDQSVINMQLERIRGIERGRFLSQGTIEGILSHDSAPSTRIVTRTIDQLMLINLFVYLIKLRIHCMSHFSFVMGQS